MVEHNAGVLQASTGVAALDKISILDGGAADNSACTFCLGYEDHTLGNALRWIIMKDPDVEFCGYSAPHPSEPKIHIRIQMYDNKSAVDCLFKALGNLRDLLTTVKTSYNDAMRSAPKVFEEDINVKQNVANIIEHRNQNAGAPMEQ